MDERSILTAADCTDGIEAEDITVWVGDTSESGHAVCGFNQQRLEFKDKDITVLDLCDPLTLSQGKFLYFLDNLKLTEFSISAGVEAIARRA